jgi:hypothetical protein
VDLNHRPLGYECHHQRHLKTMRGAKSNALFLKESETVILPAPLLPSSFDWSVGAVVPAESRRNQQFGVEEAP